jgi:drug/metabolite transporter (DMT)-like permease
VRAFVNPKAYTNGLWQKNQVVQVDIAKTRVLSVAEALLVTFLWSTSYILIKIGLEEINPLAFAAYRYAVASLILSVPLLYQHRKRLLSLDWRRKMLFLLLGFTGYFVAQGLQFFGLYYLQPVTVTFLLNLTPIFVLALSALFLNELPSSTQLVGIALTLCGVFVFFYDALGGVGKVTGVLVTLVSGVGWAIYMIISRYSLSRNEESVMILTTCSMIFGSLMLLGTTTVTGNIVAVSFNGWILILWLGVVNTAVAFTLWNQALKALQVYEQSILQNTMLIQIALLAFVFLQEPLDPQKVVGMVMVFMGVLIVQLRARRKKR